MKHLIASLLVLVSFLVTLNATSHSEMFSIGDLSIRSKERGFQEINLSDFGKTGIIGNPELPSKVVNFIIPKDQDASNLSVSVSSVHLDGAYNIMPLQTAAYINGDSSEFTDPNPSVYSCDQFYPQNYAEIISQGYIDGANHIVSIRLNPIRYNPVSQVIEFVNNLHISFSLSPSSSQPIYPVKRFAIDAPKYEACLYNLVENTGDIANYRNIPDIEVDPNGPEDFNYLIICPDDLMSGEYSPFTQFIQWKEQKGHNVRLMTYSQIANHINAGNGDDIGTHLINDTPGRVRKYLKHQWQNHGLANVLLVGGMDDFEMIRYAHNMGMLNADNTITINNKYPSDVYFAEFQGCWNNDGDGFYGEFANPAIGTFGPADDIQFFQEIFIGRVILPPKVNPPSGSPTRQQAVLNWVDKVITYEKGPGSGFDGYLNKCYSLSASGINTSAPAILANHGFNVLSVTDSFIDGDLRPFGNDVISGISSYSPGIIVLSCHGNKGRMVIADNGIHNGGIENYITSLNRYDVSSYLIGNETSNGLDNLINIHKKYPILLANSCNTGQYDYYKDNNEFQNPSMAEAFTSYTAGIGGPLWIGNTRPVLAGSFESNFVSNLFNNNVLAHYPNANPWCGGVSFTSARLTASGNMETMLARNFFGDPDMEIWTAAPAKLSITLDYAGRYVVVKDESGSVVENARVVFINATEKCVVYTDSNGLASTNINFSRVLAHKQNYVHDAIRVIQGQETIASVGDQTLDISDRLFIPANSTLNLSGRLRLIKRSSIVSDGVLSISSNTNILGSNSSSFVGDGLGNKIIVNGGITIGENVHFAAANQMGWDGIWINNGDAVISQNVTFTKSPLRLFNSIALMYGNSMMNSPLTVVDGMIEIASSSFSQSTLSLANSTASFDTCNFTDSNASYDASEVGYHNSSLTRSHTTTSNSDLNIYDGSYLDSRIEVTGGKVSIQSSSMSSTVDNNIHNDAYIRTVDASVRISDYSEFTRCCIKIYNYGLTLNSISVVITNSIIHNCAGSGIDLFRIANFDIRDNTITHNQAGISLLNSGTGFQNTLKNNVIENNIGAGIRIVASKVYITGHNEIQQNSIGVTAANLSSWSMTGMEFSPTGEYQLVQYNHGNQVLMANDSAPDYLTYNCIQNSHHNTPWIRVFSPDSNGRQINVSRNYWGEIFNPNLDLSPLSAFVYDPTWTPGNIQAIVENAAAALFRDANYHELNAEYQAAIADYKQIINLFPGTEYAILASKALLRIEDVKKDQADPNLNYEALKTYYESDNNLYLNQEIEYITSSLIAQINLRIENYIDAIRFYESVISDPPSSADSLYAVINLGYTYLLMEESTKGQSYIGRYINLKPIGFSEWSENTERLLNEIDILYSSNEHNVASQIIMMNNYPNPFNPSTTISFSLPSDMACKLEIYNIRGQKVHTLLNENMMAGKHSVVWDGKDDNGRSVSSGVYFYRLVTPNRSQTSKMLLMK